MDIQEAKIIMSSWGEKPQEIIKVRDAFRVVTYRGVRCLKQVHDKSEKVLFVAEVMKYLRSKGFMRMARFIPALDGNYVIRHRGKNYVVQEWLEGIEPDYRNQDEMILAAETLALCHRAGTGFFPPKGQKSKNNLGKWPRKLEENLKEITGYLDKAKKASPAHKFDRIFAESGLWIIKHAKESINRLNNLAYFQLVEEADLKGALIHGDPAARNFLCLNNEMYLIDFDSTAVDIGVVDLWKMLRRTLRRNHWDIGLMKKILEAYTKYIPLEKRHFEVLAAFLEFPERAWRICREYYDKQNEGWWDDAGLTEKINEYLKQREEIDRLLVSLETEVIN